MTQTKTIAFSRHQKKGKRDYEQTIAEEMLHMTLPSHKQGRIATEEPS